ncbi:hypothetical protein D3C73_1432500 [compost metagenome]
MIGVIYTVKLRKEQILHVLRDTNAVITYINTQPFLFFPQCYINAIGAWRIFDCIAYQIVQYLYHSILIRISKEITVKRMNLNTLNRLHVPLLGDTLHQFQ